MTLPILATLAACLWSPPDVAAVQPAVLMPGDAFTVTGTGFDGEDEGALVNGSDEVTVPLDVRSPTEAAAEVPADLPSGRWSLQVRRPGGRHGDEAPVEVWRPETEPPCDKRYALSVDTSRTVDKVVVERVFTDRPATRDVFLRDDLSAIVHTRTSTADGGTCSAVWLVTSAGDRWLLADDAAKDLEPVARELAGSLGVPLR